MIPLSNGELEAVHWSMNGKRDVEIGELLGIKGHSVTNRINRAMDKLGALTRAQLGAMMMTRKG